MKQEQPKTRQTLGTLSILFAFAGLFLVPFICGPLSFLFGLIGVCKHEGRRSIIGLILSFILTPIGFFTSTLFWFSFFAVLAHG